MANLKKETENKKLEELKRQRSSSAKPYYETLLGPRGTLDNTIK
jgi:hypothetical protein